MWVRTILLAAALALAPLSARAADLVIWWDKGYYPDEDAALQELVTAFEQKNGKKVELVQHPQSELKSKVEAAIEAGAPPDVIAGIDINSAIPRWAYEGRLADLTDAVGSLRNLFDPDLIEAAMLLDGSTGRRALYALPIGRATNQVHVWKSLLERAGFRLDDIPKEWEPFWSFWCDRVQPAVRKSTGRDDIWGAGLVMAVDPEDTAGQFDQFLNAYDVYWADRDGRLTVDDHRVRARLIRALDSYTSISRKRCTPPDATDWGISGNNKAFLEQRVVMTVNGTLSIPNALKADRPDDYYKNAVTIAWPDGAYGQPLVVGLGGGRMVVLRSDRDLGPAKEFVRFLVADEWLVHYDSFTHERLLPPMSKLLDQPFWLDPNDPHRMAVAIQALTKPMGNIAYLAEAADWRLMKVWQEKVWPKAIHRVATEGIAPEQAVDEAIARIKQLLSE
jgi:multiple sugar transport system substrate-binding protein